MAMQSYGTAPSRNTAAASGPPKGLIASAMGKPKKARKKGKKKCSSK
jgi:hypothetical protein